MPGSAAFIIDIAGAKLRSVLASTGAMLFFALCRRSAVDDAQSASGSHRQKGTLGSLVPESPFFPNALAPSAVVWSGKLYALCIRVPPRYSIASTFVSVREDLATHRMGCSSRRVHAGQDILKREGKN